MSNTWFISDTHFNHRKITDFEPMRPANFEDVIFDNINTLVEPHDHLYHLGDFTFGHEDQRERVAARWKAIRCASKTLLLGNHDRHAITYYMKLCGFDEIYPIYKVIHLEGQGNVILSHYPHYRSKSPDGDPRYKDMKIQVRKAFNRQKCVLNVHGHLHSNVVDDPRYLNVSVERTNLGPVDLDYVASMVPDSR